MSSPSQPPPPQPPEAPSGRSPGRSTPEERQHALMLLASGMKAREVAASVGRSYEAIRLWRKKAEAAGSMPVPPVALPSSDNGCEPTDSAPSSTSPSSSPGTCPQRAPKDPGKGLGGHEVAAILELKERHPAMGPAQIRAQLKRFKGWRVASRAIARVLREHGYETVHVASRPQGEEDPKSWEAPQRNALWQLDFAELRVGPERVSLLVVLDDFSRYVVGHELFLDPTSEDVVGVLREAIHRHGKPEAIYTDRGGPFTAWKKDSALGGFLESELIDHHVSAAYRPQGRGKVEALIHTLQRELWHVVHFESVAEARDRLSRFLRGYNERRAHMGIGGLTPADRFFGRWEEVLERIDAASRGRQGATFGSGPDPFTEESLVGGPVEILRLVHIGGRMELHFLGHRVTLGRVKP